MRFNDIPPASIEMISVLDAKREVMYKTEMKMKIGEKVLSKLGTKLR
jgi:hypothetical protein